MDRMETSSSCPLLRQEMDRVKGKVKVQEGGERVGMKARYRSTGSKIRVRKRMEVG
jgi:hypothetical protein